MVFVYAFKAILNRALTAILLTSAIGSLACANRGMHAPGDGGAAGTVATGGRGGSSDGGRGGSGGTAPGGTGGGPTGTGGMGGTTGAAGNCNVPPDAGASGGAGGACSAMFNFESGVQGATIGTGMAFTMVKQSGAFTFCGSGALAITAAFSGSVGATTKGEILLNLPSVLDLTGKTITVHVASDPGCSQNLNLSMVLNTQAGPIYFNPDFPILNVTNMWKTGATTVGAVNGSTTALAISLQVTSPNGYQGTIYVDEIDVR